MSSLNIKRVCDSINFVYCSSEGSGNLASLK
jgi:hypothetical protein